MLKVSIPSLPRRQTSNSGDVATMPSSVSSDSLSKEKAKGRYTLRIKETLGTRKARNSNADLTGLSERFNDHRACLNQLVVVLRAQHAAMIGYAKSRIEVSAQ